MVSPQSEILIVFTSDNQDNYYSFLINYHETCESPTKILQSGEQTNGNGIIFAPTKNINVGFNTFNWTLKSANNKKFKLKVYFNNFVDYTNFKDYVGIYDSEQKYQIAGLGFSDNNIEYIYY